MKKTGPACRQAGFTFIELLVTITIIGVIMAISLASYRSAQAKSRDSKRHADLKQIQAALEMCRTETGCYLSSADFPAAGDPLDCGGETYMTSLPGDPDGSGYQYVGVCLSYTLSAPSAELEVISYQNP